MSEYYLTYNEKIVSLYKMPRHTGLATEPVCYTNLYYEISNIGRPHVLPFMLFFDEHGKSMYTEEFQERAMWDLIVQLGPVLE